MNQFPGRSRFFQISLGKLLLAVVFVAVLCCARWIGLPWLEPYWERWQFERRAVQIKAGMTGTDVEKILIEKGWQHAFIIDDHGNWATLVCEDFKYGIDFLVCRLPKVYEHVDQSEPNQYGRNIVSVELYRVPVIPKRYEPRTDIGRANNTDPMRGYMNDFLATVCGQASGDQSMPYELIYSDPPIGH